MSTYRNFIDISGNDYGLLHVISLHHTENRKSYWLCRCKCGKEVIVRKDNLIYNYSKQKSCGCLHRSNSSTRMLKYNECRRDTLSQKG